MKNKMLAVLAGALMMMSVPAFADPCGAVLCLSTNKFSPQQCQDEVDEYFNIKVCHNQKKKGCVFDPGATAIKRYDEVLDQCPDAEQKDKDYVNATYGTLEHSPFSFY